MGRVADDRIKRCTQMAEGPTAPLWQYSLLSMIDFHTAILKCSRLECESLCISKKERRVGCRKLVDPLAEVVAESPTNVLCLRLMWHFEMEMLSPESVHITSLNHFILGFYLYIETAIVPFGVFDLYWLFLLPVTTGSTTYLHVRDHNSTWSNCLKCVTRDIQSSFLPQIASIALTSLIRVIVMD